MEQNYRHLSHQEREAIYLLHAEGKSLRAVALALRRSPATISRELRRNRTRVGYLPDTAQSRYIGRRWGGYKLERYPQLRSEIFAQLLSGWSPDVIAGMMQKRSASHYACAETIYRYLYFSPFARKHQLYRLLPWQRIRRRKRRAPACKSRIPGRISYLKRPISAKNRSRFGHWEADLVHFHQQNQNIITMTERKSRYFTATLNPSKHTENTMKNMAKTIESLPVKTITFDNGTEFAGHQNLHKTGIQTFFCDPYSSWQKGSVEHANGLLRRFLPSKTNLATISQEMLDRIANHINSIPRKSLGYKSPAELLNRCTSF